MAGKKESEGLQGPQNARWCSLFAHRKVPGRLDPFILYRDGTAQCSKEPGERIKQKLAQFMCKLCVSEPAGSFLDILVPPVGHE